MLKKVKNIIRKVDRFLYEKFGSDKSLKFLENIKEAQIIFSSLNDVGKEHAVRFVGGCVRKALCGHIIDDIDLATSLEPEEVKRRLKKKDIKVIDTGISHGTVTVIINDKKFEITTLRKDISTDGRHAKVEYTSDWTDDAARRDFTINAIYADIDGRIFDPTNGLSDLKNGKIKFIGSPNERIEEDYIRILRYFRFFLQYSKVDHDPVVIKYIKQHINGLNKISNERIFDEVLKIFKVKNIFGLFENIESKEILINIFPQFKFYERLKNFSNLNEKLIRYYDHQLILALLLVDQTDNYEFFCYKYKTSNIIKDRFKNISRHFESLHNKIFYSEQNIKKLIYFNNKNSVIDILLFSKCLNIKIKEINIESLLDYAKLCKIPKFPISGSDLKQYGYESGLKLGQKLKLLEEKWVQNDFIIDKNLEKFLKKTN